MPNKLMGTGQKKGSSFDPARHGRHIQAWPILYHYTGWRKVKERYDIFENIRKGKYTRDWFLQTGYWQRESYPKNDTTPPEPIRDLRALEVSRSGIRLQWTSPSDIGPEGKAKKYFIKYSKNPITEFAPMDNPARKKTMLKIAKQAEDLIIKRSIGKKNITVKARKILTGEVEFETTEQLADPDWYNIDSFWMAEHVAGEPAPATPGTTETFTIKKIRPHSRFGIEDADLDTLTPGIYYFAICTWDSDRNLSKPSNVIAVEIE
jgi:hypothetical protein